MITFMIIGLPRSGTTWASNLFCTDKTLCFHDPLYKSHYSDWDAELKSTLVTGVSCTGIWQWTDWLNKHPARKVILHRDNLEIRKSMLKIGLPEINVEEGLLKLDKIMGLHVPHTDLFNEQECLKIWRYLLHDKIPFNAERHKQLLDIEMQPKFSGLSVGKDVTRRLIIELSSIMDTK